MSKLEELINTKFGEDESQEVALDEIYFDFEDGEDEETYDSHLTKDDEEENAELDITHELSDINEAINTTLSKYFE